MFHAEQIEASETDYLTPYSSSDPFYNDATDLSSYMVKQDVEMIPDVLQCNLALKEGRHCTPRKARQELVRNELKIQNPTWSRLQGDTRKAWSNESNENKEKCIPQFIANSKSSGPVTKNHNLRTVYKLEFKDGDVDGYYFDCTANSDGTYCFDVNTTMFDTTADDSNGERVVEGNDLNVNAAARKK